MGDVEREYIRRHPDKSDLDLVLDLMQTLAESWRVYAPTADPSGPTVAMALATALSCTATRLGRLLNERRN